MKWYKGIEFNKQNILLLLLLHMHNSVVGRIPVQDMAYISKEQNWLWFWSFQSTWTDGQTDGQGDSYIPK
jgi:hypothetical protein